MEYKLHVYHLLLSFGVHITQARTNLYVDETMVSLGKEAQRCRLATPEIIYTSSGPSITLPHELSIQHGEKLRVGYIKTLRVFEYIGCVWHGDLHLQYSFSIRYETSADPGQCFSACQTKYIGIYNNDCFCSSVAVYNLKHNYAKCDIACYNAPGTVCGGETLLYSYVSFYKRVSDEPRLLDDGKHCGTFISNDGVHSWRACDTWIHGLCQADALLPTTLETTLRSWTWDSYSRLCFRKGHYPAVGNISTLYLNIYASEIWIGRVKGHVISQITHSASDDYYGFVTKTGGSFQLIFSREHRIMHSLCVNETTLHNKTTSVALATTQSTSLSTYSSSSNGATDNASTISHTTEGTTYGDETKHEGWKSIQVAVYISVPTAVVAIVTVVVLLIIRWRRNKRQQTVENPPDAEYAGGNQRPEASGRAVANAAYDREFATQPPDSDSQDHEYFVLESRDEYSTVKASGQSLDVNEDYDTTNALCKRNRDAPLEGNVYNTFVDKVDDTYDHSRYGPGTNTESRNPTRTHHGIEDTYNHVMQDGGYGTTADTRLHDDETYNHAHYSGLK